MESLNSPLIGYCTIDVTVPKQSAKVISDSYWLCKDGDQKQALFYNGKYPQCNKQKFVLQQHVENIESFAGCPLEIVFIAIAYVPTIN